ncbi:DUF6221 family protein [Microlunatus speluncae]|uniref:DUF6221 family protein n=1 Tax=Microlunatus speluncae TaxID=2594267 RepID=UPI0012666ABE|nr:DUF6221 family protein [Microlunatus speluncae]
MTDLFKFLDARITDDEAAIKELRDPDAKIDTRPGVDHPDRLRAELTAKRMIIADHAPDARAAASPTVRPCRQCTASRNHSRVTIDWDVDARVEAPCDTVRILGAVYADHPDYREAWRP